ncbi:radical SAM protein [Clostridium aminobutyricum]|uniref:Radical SAM protein n=1 Tax=Clostridium aminobutyricum TaxID=33953 RepID=A0A939DA85_CLOAM|nr:radical SAM protein [Clostridium aminobutyricum]MBN7773975.1 radical SAM protein [Clostridium aminobutyricum]
MTIIKNEAQKELTLDEVVEQYTEIPRLIAIKIDVQRRGVHYTDRALSAADESLHQLRGAALFGSRDAQILPLPESLILRDGTTVLTDPVPVEQNPYFVDYIDGKLVLTDQDKVIEEVDYWPQPNFYHEKTKSGIPMDHIVTVRPQRLQVMPSSYCHFWDNGNGCKYCDIVNHLKQQTSELGISAKLRPEDVREVIGEALKQPGRFSSICLTAGSDTRGTEAFDEEVDYYIKILKAIGDNFTTKKFPSQLIATAFTEKQLTRLYEETGLMSYTADIEVLNEELFNWICPGKAEWIGYKEWKNRLIRAVDIFGRGNVNTGIVSGIELAKPNGFTNEEEALKTTLEEAEHLASHGVSTVYMVWIPRPKSYFRDQKNASLEYYVRMAIGLNDLRKKYKLPTDMDDYRRCGNHPDSDLSRIL